MDIGIEIVKEAIKKIITDSNINISVVNTEICPVLTVFGGLGNYGISITVDNGVVVVLHMGVGSETTNLTGALETEVKLKNFKIDLHSPRDPIDAIREGFSKAVIDDINRARSVNSHTRQLTPICLR
jgi:hypothetical protein